ncbi:MAG: hypothetical protein WCC95_03355 [Candidatus Sulfotelmatobacter sp.]
MPQLVKDNAPSTRKLKQRIKDPLREVSFPYGVLAVGRENEARGRREVFFVPTQRSDGKLTELNPPLGLFGLWRFQEELAFLVISELQGDVQPALVKVNVLPTQPEDFTLPHCTRCREHEQSEIARRMVQRGLQNPMGFI